jgi:hypothetical protein
MHSLREILGGGVSSRPTTRSTTQRISTKVAKDVGDMSAKASSKGSKSGKGEREMKSQGLEYGAGSASGQLAQPQMIGEGEGDGAKTE